MALRGLETKVRAKVRERFIRDVVTRYLEKASASEAGPNPITELVEPLRNAGYVPAGLTRALLLLRSATGGRVKRSIIFGERGEIVGVRHTRPDVTNDPGQLPTVDDLVNAILGAA